MGTDTLRVEEFPRGDLTSVVTLKGDEVPGADKRGQEEDKNSPDTWDTEGNNVTRHVEYMASG